MGAVDEPRAARFDDFLDAERVEDGLPRPPPDDLPRVHAEALVDERHVDRAAQQRAVRP